MTTSVPIYPPVFARHDAKVTLGNIPTGQRWSKLISRSGRERNSESDRRFSREWRAITRGIDAVIDAEEAGTGADAEILDECGHSVESRVASGITERDKRATYIRKLDTIDRDHLIPLYEEEMIAAERKEIHGRERA